MAKQAQKKLVIGNRVYWYPYGDTASDPRVGFVTGLGRDSISLTAVTRSPQVIVKRSVMHKDADKAKADLLSVREEGLWDWFPGEVYLDADPPALAKKAEPAPAAEPEPAQIHPAVPLKLAGKSIMEIAAVLGMSRTQVQEILSTEQNKVLV